MAHAATISAIHVAASATSLHKGQSANLSCTATFSDGTVAACPAPAFTENMSGTVVSIAGSAVTGSGVGKVVVTAEAAGLRDAVVMTGTPPTQEDLGAVTAQQAFNGLGFNVDPGSDWEFQMAAAAGATHVRIQCGWATAESQTAPPQNTASTARYALQSYCQSALKSAAAYKLHPTVIAAYGSPYHSILSLTVPSGAPAGATEIGVQFASGAGGDTIGSLRALYDTIIRADGGHLSSRHSYAGSLVAGVRVIDPNHATLTLASALTAPLPANTSTVYTVNEYLYPPPANFSPADPSVMAYAQYAQFLAQSIASAGLTGEVEIWNEPPWQDDPWDDLYDFYDIFPGSAAPGPRSTYLPNWGFASAIEQRAPPTGVTYIWGGTAKSGSNSVFDQQMQQNTGIAFAEPANGVASETFHPYGNSPEDGLWSAPCLAATSGNNDFFTCNLFGVSGGNFAIAAQNTVLEQRKNPAWGVAHNITETGFSLGSGDAAHQARFIMRQFLGFEAAGVTPIEFYRLFDAGSEQLGFLDTKTRSPLPAYTAIAGLMADLAKIKAPPVTAFPASSLASVVGYSGTYPLDTVHLVGSRPGDSRNSDLFAVWQRSYTGSSDRWSVLAQPAPAPVTIAIPSGLSVAAVINLDTRQVVPYQVSGQQVVFNVSDDPIELLLEPLANSVAVTSIAITPAVTSLPVTAQTTYACTAYLSDGSSGACSSPTFTSSDINVATFAGPVATAKKGGTTTITATVSGPGATATATASLSVTTTAKVLLSGLSHVYSGTPQGVSVATTPAGLSFATTYAGKTMRPTGAGSYAVSVRLTDPVFSASATGTMVISKAAPILQWSPSVRSVGAGMVLGSGVLDAVSSVPGSFSYTATSTTGDTLYVNPRTILNPGSYIITVVFTPSDTSNFTKATTSVSFTVAAKLATR